MVLETPGYLYFSIKRISYIKKKSKGDMIMFCYQCEETVKGTGCTIKGVCGKDDEIAAW